MSNLINYEFETIYGINQKLREYNEAEIFKLRSFSYSVKNEAIKNITSITARGYFRKRSDFETKKNSNRKYEIIEDSNLYVKNFEFKALELGKEIYFISKNILYKGYIDDILYQVHSQYNGHNGRDYILSKKVVYVIKYKKLNKNSLCKIELTEDYIFTNKKLALEIMDSSISNIEEKAIKEKITENLVINSLYGINQEVSIIDGNHPPFTAIIRTLYYSLVKGKFDFADMNILYGNIHNRLTLQKKRTFERRGRRININSETPLYEQFFNLNVLSLNQNVYFYNNDALFSGKIIDVIVHISEDLSAGGLKINVYYKVSSKQKYSSVYLKEENISFNKNEAIIYKNRIINNIEN